MENPKKLGIDDLLHMKKADRNKAFSEGIKNGTVKIPSKKEDSVAAAKWKKFYLMEPEEILKEESAQKPVAEPNKETPPQPSGEKLPEPTEKPAEKPAEKEPKKESRFKTVEEAENELLEKEKLLSEQTGSVSKLNEAVSSTAVELKRAQEENEKLKKLIAEKPAEKVEEIKIPDLPDEPELPDASDGDKYPEGIYDESYKKDMSQYKQNVTTFKRVRKDRDAIINASLKKANETLLEVTGLKSKVSEFEEFKKTSAQQKIKEETEKATSTRDSVIDDMLAKIGVSFKKPWKEINEARLIANNKDASPEARNAADAYLKSLSKEDKDSFENLVKAANVVFTKDGTPLYQNKPKMFRAALEEEGFSFKEETPKKPNEVDLTKLKTETKASQGISPDRMGSDDRMDDLTRSQKEEKLKELDKQFDEVAKSGKVERINPKLFNERKTLMAELGIVFG